jgi:hypothetical protein
MHSVIALSVALLAGAEAKPKLLVLDVTASGGAPEALAQSITAAVSSEAVSRGFYEVLTSREIATILSIDRQKQLLGCSPETGNCMTELAGALQSRFVLSGNVTRFGDALQLNLQLFDNTKNAIVYRATRLAKTESDLRVQVIYAVAEATGTPLPPPPSKVLPVSLLAGGGALFIFGAVLGIVTLTAEATMAAELQQGAMFPQVLKSHEYYEAQRQSHGLQRTVSLISIIAGAAMVAGGAFLFPPDVVASSSLRVALRVGPSGFGVAGSF